MKKQLDMDKIAQKIGAERRGKVSATSGYFGAAQLAAEIEARFRPPAKGGRFTEPNWTVRRLIGLSPGTFDQLRRFTRKINNLESIQIEPMQLAALLLEYAIQQTTDHDLEKLTTSRSENKEQGRLHCSGSASGAFPKTKSVSKRKSIRR